MRKSLVPGLGVVLVAATLLAAGNGAVADSSLQTSFVIDDVALTAG